MNKYEDNGYFTIRHYLEGNREYLEICGKGGEMPRHDEVERILHKYGFCVDRGVGGVFVSEVSCSAGHTRRFKRIREKKE